MNTTWCHSAALTLTLVLTLNPALTLNPTLNPTLTLTLTQVFDPIVEDEVPEVERADETFRLMHLYSSLIAAARDAAQVLLRQPQLNLSRA